MLHRDCILFFIFIMLTKKIKESGSKTHCLYTKAPSKSFRYRAMTPKCFFRNVLEMKQCVVSHSTTTIFTYSTSSTHTLCLDKTFMLGSSASMQCNAVQQMQCSATTTTTLFLSFTNFILSERKKNVNTKSALLYNFVHTSEQS